ncbi:MAG: RecQ family ATP-dependent DNA helicase [Chitinophagaceae bacterium]|nr:RecQ family ATP-dependent DNA helicase [Chitinophagaceae bacterium]
MNIHCILKQYWGYESFRPLQEDIIQSILQGRDVLALLPTGGGKSVCFQVPAMAMEGLCLVISPLIALMKDQVENLRKKNITAYAIYSGMSRKEVINVLKVAGESNCKFLYVSPERLETNLFLEYLPSFNTSLIAVDEAHCISQWGYDFRPPYLRISELRKELPGVPVLALTASATPDVQEDICEKLVFKKHSVFRQSFERPNLSYSVFKVDSKINKIIDILQKVMGSGIVYCKSRRRTKDISDLLNMHGIVSGFYHAGLTPDERSAKQEAWINNQTRTMVCTNAFGMGIDKPDVRIVIHADAPDCVENYYQEAGRAGRDGKKAYAVLLYEAKEPEELQNLPQIRFPATDQIRLVYQSLMNYLQVPSGLGEGNYYDFDMNDFIRKFNHDTQLALYSLKALEQEQLLSFNEQVFLPSRIQFTTNKEILYEFENSHPDLEPVIKTLLRTYEGIFDQPVFIYERAIAFILRQDGEFVRSSLKQLQAFSIIRYTPQKDSPQIFFIQNRVRTEDLFINEENHKKRRQQLSDRIRSFVKYIDDKKTCRSTIIGIYFGDTTVKPCGICDTCLDHHNHDLSSEEFEKIHRKIIALIQPKPFQSRDLLNQLPGIKKEKAWRVVHFLQAENKIEVDKDGMIRLK